MPEKPAAHVGGAAGSVRAPRGGQRDAGLLAIAITASITLHAVTVALGLLRPGAPVAQPGEQVVSVEILSPDELAALTTRPASPIAPVPRAEAHAEPGLAALLPAPEALPPPRDRMVRPSEMLSARELADPRSAEARAMLPRLDDAERMVQLCGIEAMAQVHAWRPALRPDRIVSHAGGEVAVSGDAVEAGEAAFRNGDDWYALAYECRLSPDHATVTAFAFTVGGVLPPEEWELRNLADPALDRD